MSESEAIVDQPSGEEPSIEYPSPVTEYAKIGFIAGAATGVACCLAINAQPCTTTACCCSKTILDASLACGVPKSSVTLFLLKPAASWLNCSDCCCGCIPFIAAVNAQAVAYPCVPGIAAAGVGAVAGTFVEAQQSCRKLLCGGANQESGVDDSNIDDPDDFYVPLLVGDVLGTSYQLQGDGINHCAASSNPNTLNKFVEYLKKSVLCLFICAGDEKPGEKPPNESDTDISQLDGCTL